VIAHYSAGGNVHLSQDGSQRWVILENIARFEKRLASETCRAQHNILEKLVALERGRLVGST
jgi:hypothetical protein